MGDLTPHFSRKEFACKCGCGSNDISLRLVATLETFRTLVGRPIRILSGCRCSSHNKQVGGKANSYHLIGRAADIRVDGVEIAKLHSLARGSKLFNGIGYYPSRNFIHLDNRIRPGYWTEE